MQPNTHMGACLAFQSTCDPLPLSGQSDLELDPQALPLLVLLLLLLLLLLLVLVVALRIAAGTRQ